MVYDENIKEHPLCIARHLDHASISIRFSINYVYGNLNTLLMKNIFLLLATAIMLLSSCSKDKDINVTNLVGTWDECYDNPHFIMDGTVEYTFYENGTYQVYSYDAFSHMEHTRTNTYVLQDDLLILNTEHSENALRYHIVEFKKNEMAWQMEGTEYSGGTWGSEYKHFKRKKGND
jgi:hypothetical protein